MNDRIIPITDDRGKCLLPTDDCFEPEPSSIVLTNGQYGTAWQRHFADGLWHRVGGNRAFTWERMLQERNLVLVYDAEPRTLTPVRTVSTEDSQ